MDKQVAELIKTLNGGLKQLPDLAKEMVHQYVVGHAVVGAIWTVISVIILVSAFFLGKYALKSLQEYFRHESAIKTARFEEKIAWDRYNDLSITDSKQGVLHDEWKEKSQACANIVGTSDNYGIMVMTSVLCVMLGIVGIMMFASATSDIYKALTPIWSIVNSLKG